MFFRFSAALKPSWDRLGGVLEALGSALGASWRRLGGAWQRLGGVLEGLGGFEAVFEGILHRLLISK